jgi:hypothetical protein
MSRCRNSWRYKLENPRKIDCRYHFVG